MMNEKQKVIRRLNETAEIDLDTIGHVHFKGHRQQFSITFDDSTQSYIMKKTVNKKHIMTGV